MLLEHRLGVVRRLPVMRGGASMDGVLGYGDVVLEGVQFTARRVALVVADPAVGVLEVVCEVVGGAGSRGGASRVGVAGLVCIFRTACPVGHIGVLRLVDGACYHGGAS